VYVLNYIVTGYAMSRLPRPTSPMQLEASQLDFCSERAVNSFILHMFWRLKCSLFIQWRCVDLVSCGWDACGFKISQLVEYFL